MKKALFLSFLLTSATCFAETRELLCQSEPHMSNGVFGISFDKLGLDPDRQVFRIRNASWSFSYSSASMICSTDRVDFSEGKTISCVGYNTAGGLTEISAEIEDNKGTAKVHHFGAGVEDNIYSAVTEGMTLPCQLIVNQ